MSSLNSILSPMQACLTAELVRGGCSRLVFTDAHCVGPKQIEQAFDVSLWEKAWRAFRKWGWIPASVGLSAFLAQYAFGSYGHDSALVTVVGANYMAADFLGSSSNRVNQFNYHDCGAGVTAATVNDTALQSPIGVTRGVGLQTNPQNGVYRTTALITFSGAATISEWGLFSAAAGGTMWDRRAPHTLVPVDVGDAIQYTYDLTVPAGGN